MPIAKRPIKRFFAHLSSSEDIGELRPHESNLYRALIHQHLHITHQLIICISPPLRLTFVRIIQIFIITL